jgi:asparagine synthase (glutamine-hydrolysing)
MLPSSSKNMSLDFRLKQFLRALSFSGSLRHQIWIGSFLPEELAGIVEPQLHPLVRDELIYRQVLAEARRAAQAGALPGSIDEALDFYLTRYLADDILVKADRAGMAASLEIRAPFLDTHLVEFVARLPWREKLGWGQTKVLLRAALQGLVPEEILRRPKKGFGIPVAAWIRGGLRELFEDLFSPDSLARSGVLKAKETRALLDRHLAGTVDLRKPLWTIAMFILWHRRWGSG